MAVFLANSGTPDQHGLPPAVTGVEDPDADLLARFAAGEPKAARDLIDSLGPRSFAVAFRMLGERSEAEDVAQEAMMRLWRIAPDWRTGEAKVSTWLYRVTMNLCIDRQRRRERQRNDALQAALQQLPDRQRQAVVLRHLEELSNPEIAGIMEISTEAVESLIARGKRALAAALAGRREDLGYDHG